MVDAALLLVNRGRVVGEAQVGSGGKGCSSGRIHKDVWCAHITFRSMGSFYAFVAVRAMLFLVVYIMLRISNCAGCRMGYEEVRCT